MTTAERLITVEEFERIAALPENRDRRLELIHGEIREKRMPTQAYGLYGGTLYIALASFAHPRKLGRVTIETRHQKADDPHKSIIPDISFLSAKTPLVTKGSVPQLPDLVVEIQSPDDSLKELRDKIRYCLQNGSKLGFLLIPRKKIIEVYTPDMDDVLTEEDTLTGGDVLPGFEIKVADIFADPLADVLPENENQNGDE